MRHILSKAFVTVLSLFFTLTGCDEHVLYHTYRHMPFQEWDIHDTLVFRTDTIPEDHTYSFNIEIRTNRQYPYKSIWLIAERRFAYPQQIWRDTVECALTDSTNRSKGIHFYSSEVSLPSISLQQGQTGEIRFTHFMQRQTLPGISAVGLCIKR